MSSLSVHYVLTSSVILANNSRMEKNYPFCRAILAYVNPCNAFDAAVLSIEFWASVPQILPSNCRCCTGLRLAPGGNELTRTWVVYNKPVDVSYTHAGMILALGLTGVHSRPNSRYMVTCIAIPHLTFDRNHNSINKSALRVMHDVQS